MGQMLELEGHAYSVDYLLKDEAGQRVVRYAYETGKAFCCLCNGNRALIHVYCRKGVLYLARHRGSGELHSTECDDFELNVRKRPITRTQRLVSAIHPVGDRLVCSLALQFQSFTRGSSGIAPIGKKRSHSTASQARTTLAGLLLYAWDSAGLCDYDPTRSVQQEWRTVGKHLLRQIQRIDLARGPLTSYAVIPLLHNQAEVDQKIEGVRQRHEVETARYLLAIGRIARWKELDTGEVKCWLDCMARPLHLTKKLWESMASKSWSVHARTALKLANAPSDSEHAILICRFSVDSHGQVRVVNGAIIMTTATWLPVQSKPEREVADALVDASAHFSKPIRPLPDCPFLPDFLVHKKSGDRPHEVAGMLRDTAYAQHLELKLAEYPKYFSEPAWVWRVDLEPMPPFV